MLNFEIIEIPFYVLFFLVQVNYKLTYTLRSPFAGLLQFILKCNVKSVNKWLH